MDLVEFHLYSDKHTIALSHNIFSETASSYDDPAFSNEFLEWTEGKGIKFCLTKLIIDDLMTLTNHLLSITPWEAAANARFLVPEEHALMFKLTWV